MHILRHCNANDAKGPGLEANFDSVKDRVCSVHMHELSPGSVLQILWGPQVLLASKDLKDEEDRRDLSDESVRLMKYYRALFLAYQNVI